MRRKRFFCHIGNQTHDLGMNRLACEFCACAADKLKAINILMTLLYLLIRDHSEWRFRGEGGVLRK